MNDLLHHAFSGSYQPEQVLFLLHQMNMEHTDPQQKERLIQSGEKHYSQMISHENAPSEQHLTLFHQALAQEGLRYATDVQRLANTLNQHYQHADEIVLVSLVRAGVPLGILLRQALVDLDRQCTHYGISIIRDRGIDYAALECIIQKHGADHIVFVDGWTGKGAIKSELQHSLAEDIRFKQAMQKYGHDELPLVTLADIAGCAWLAASGEDWLIPSGILGANISGLISRSICLNPLQKHQLHENCLDQWHGCIYYQHLESVDLSQYFINYINELRKDLAQDVGLAIWTKSQRQQQYQQAQGVIERIMLQYQVQNRNWIKPSIAEATRAILRRLPKMVILRESENPNTVLLRHLTTQYQIPVVIQPDIAPYHAITLIQNLSK